MMKWFWTTASLLVLLTVQPRLARAAVTEDMFQLHNTSDLVSLCSAGQADPLYVAAIHFCQGFGSGAYDVASGYQAARSRGRLFCPPSVEHRPSRNTATAEFVQWAGAHSDLMALPVTDGLLRFFADRFPCSDAVPAKENRR